MIPRGTHTDTMRAGREGRHNRIRALSLRCSSAVSAETFPQRRGTRACVRRWPLPAQKCRCQRTWRDAAKGTWPHTRHARSTRNRRSSKVRNQRGKPTAALALAQHPLCQRPLTRESAAAMHEHDKTAARQNTRHEDRANARPPPPTSRPPGGCNPPTWCQHRTSKAWSHTT